MIEMIILSMLVISMVGFVIVAEMACKMRRHYSRMLVTATIIGLMTSMVGIVIWVIVIRM